jgi:hypothetical protein
MVLQFLNVFYWLYYYYIHSLIMFTLQSLHSHNRRALEDTLSNSFILSYLCKLKQKFYASYVINLAHIITTNGILITDSQCFCGNIIQYATLSTDGNCNDICDGNPNEFCGGTDYISIWMQG